MKERPIIFSAPMVRAILDGRKTQTRRIVKPQPPCLCRYEINGGQSHALCFGEVDGKTVCVPPTAKSIDHRLPCPYGVPGDRLWVKENFYCDVEDDDPNAMAHLYYPAEAKSDNWCCDLIPECSCAEVGKPKKRPSIHMPRWASRITLEIANVRVERVKDIGEEDAKAEGTPDHTGKHNAYYTTKVRFRDLWESIHGIGSWDRNDFVWVIEFRRLEENP